MLIIERDERPVSQLRKVGPKPGNALGRLCPACKEPFVAGDYTTVVALGPGADPQARASARAGLPYNAVALEVHWACATGEES